MTSSNPHNQFRQRLLAGDNLIGSFVKTPSMMIAEVLAATELDVLCFDAEHAPFDRKDIDASVLAARSKSMPSVIRVPSSSGEYIQNALDCGATGVVVPHVDSVEKAESIVKAARYSHGRGYAGSTRSASYGGNSIAENKAINQQDATVIAQIENKQGLDRIDAIAQVEGIDCLFIGMMDLSLSLGAASSKDDIVIQAAETICATANKYNRRLGIFVPNIDDIAFWRAKGVSLFLLSSDHGFIKKGAATLVSSAHKAFV